MQAVAAAAAGTAAVEEAAAGGVAAAAVNGVATGAGGAAAAVGGDGMAFLEISLIFSVGGSALMSRRFERDTLPVGKVAVLGGKSNLGLLEGKIGSDWLLASSLLLLFMSSCCLLTGLAGADDDFLVGEDDDETVKAEDGDLGDDLFDKVEAPDSGDEAVDLVVPDGCRVLCCPAALIWFSKTLRAESKAYFRSSTDCCRLLLLAAVLPAAVLVVLPAALGEGAVFGDVFFPVVLVADGGEGRFN